VEWVWLTMSYLPHIGIVFGAILNANRTLRKRRTNRTVPQMIDLRNRDSR